VFSVPGVTEIGQDAKRFAQEKNNSAYINILFINVNDLNLRDCLSLPLFSEAPHQKQPY
jgi:hypothetical protein